MVMHITHLRDPNPHVKRTYYVRTTYVRVEHYFQVSSWKPPPSVMDRHPTRIFFFKPLMYFIRDYVDLPRIGMDKNYPINHAGKNLS